MFKHILVPTDGSELSTVAVKAAIPFAKLHGARLTAFYAMEAVPSAAFGDYDLEDALSPDEFRASEEEKARRILSAVEEASKAAGVPCDTTTLATHHPYEAIIKTAQDQGCDLIFMASHGRRGMSALVLGSETNKVLTHCTIPAMVYR
jgi:nucleotide-binding universal stress UspA family protein